MRFLLDKPSDSVPSMIIRAWCLVVGLPIGVALSNLITSHVVHPPASSVPASSVPASSVPASSVPGASPMAQYHYALARAATIDQTCYDSKTSTWVVHSALSHDHNSWPRGWYYDKHSNIQTMELGNHTYLIMNINDILNKTTYPDVSNLDCMHHDIKQYHPDHD